MHASLLEKWLAHYDPLHRGWTPAGIANGVCATNGFGFPRIRGGYHLRRRVGGTPQTEDAIVGSAGADATSIRTFPWVTHSANTTYTYRLTAIGGGGVENAEEVTATTAVFDEDGEWAGLCPNPPTDLRVHAQANGRFLLRWVYLPQEEQVPPAHFRVYHNAGSGEVNWGSPAATVAYRRGQVHFAYASDAFADGTRRRWGVRAVSADGVEERNTVTVEAWADARGPAKNPAVVIRAAPERAER